MDELHPDWQIATEFRWTNPKGLVYDLEVDTEFRIKGEQGTFKFRRHVINAEGDEWIDAFGGSSGHGMYRAFRAARIRDIPGQKGRKPPSVSAPTRGGLPV